MKCTIMLSPEMSRQMRMLYDKDNDKDKERQIIHPIKGIVPQPNFFKSGEPSEGVMRMLSSVILLDPEFIAQCSIVDAVKEWTDQ